MLSDWTALLKFVVIHGVFIEKLVFSIKRMPAGCKNIFQRLATMHPQAKKNIF